MVAIVTTLAEEAGLAAIVLWVLPWLGVEIPLVGLAVLMVVWAVFAVFSYTMGSRALRKKPIITLPDMVGSRGKVVSPLATEGMVIIKGELWQASSLDGAMNIGEEVAVVKQDGLKLMVRRSGGDSNQ